MSLSKSISVFFLCFVVTSLVGCGTYREVKGEYFPDEKKIDYKQAKAPKDPLEVPPDLTKSTIDQGLAVPDISPLGTASYSDYSRERQGKKIHTDNSVLPKQQGIQYMRDGNTRWLVVQGDPGQVWPKAREFLLQAGFLIKREDPRIGILETDWAENRADIPQDFIRRAIGKAFDGLYSSATRDKFRVRLEKDTKPHTTDVFLTHRGAEEVVDNSGDTTVWKPRKSDPGLEAEMLRRMAVYFGLDEKRSHTQFVRARQVKQRALLSRKDDGEASLSIKEDFARAWRRTGLALDRVGFTVEDRDRSKRFYYVRYIDPLKDSNSGGEKGFLDRFNFFSSSDDKDKNTKYTVSLIDRGAETEVRVLNEKGKNENSSTAYRILTLIQEQLN